MTYVVIDNCIACKYTDCVEVCPVDCFYEGENMLVIHPDECIDCGVCEPECPNQAIYMGEAIYEIDPHKCTECVGHFDQPQCMEVCPVACIPVDPNHVETRETLWQKFHRLQETAKA